MLACELEEQTLLLGGWVVVHGAWLVCDLLTVHVDQTCDVGRAEACHADVLDAVGVPSRRG